MIKKYFFCVCLLIDELYTREINTFQEKKKKSWKALELLKVEVGCRENVESDVKFVEIVIGVLVSIAKNAQKQAGTNRNAYKIPNLQKKKT